MAGDPTEAGPNDPHTARAPDRDRVVRALTSDDTFRVMVAVTTSTVKAAIAAQRVKGQTARHFADLLTGAVLVRETMSPQYRVQAVLKGAGGRGSLVADAHPDGMTRGLVQLPSGVDEVRFGTGNSLQMTRAGAARNYQSITEPESEGVAEALMLYLQTSEQIVSVTAVGAWGDGDGIDYAGGYVVQLLPGAARGPLMVMTERLATMPSIGELLAEVKGDAEALLAELLHLMPHTLLGDSIVYHGCRCDERAVLATLATLPRSELIDLMRNDEILEISCHYCNTDYQVPSAKLRGLVDPS